MKSARFLLLLMIVGQWALPKDMRDGVPSANRWQHRQWEARWISPSAASTYDYGVHLFRKSFSLGELPERFVIHVSADQRYELFVNGHTVVRGPAAGGLLTWNYETLDVAPFLQPGDNVIAAAVVNYGRWTPGAQASLFTALIVQGDTEQEQAVNTDRNWMTCVNEAYKPSLVNMAPIDIGPADQITGRLYPWGWHTLDFDASGWYPVAVGEPCQPKGTGTQYQRALQPRAIPLPELKEEPPMLIRRSEGVELAGVFLEDGDLRIAPHSTVRILLDQGYLTNAFVEVMVSGGTQAKLGLMYEEALYGPDGNKGNRNDVAGKVMRGVQDVIFPEGSVHRVFRPLDFKTFRYVELEIETKEEDLVFHGFKRTFVGYPFEQRAKFESDDPLLGRIWDTGWRTARLCAVDLYYDCPYYERLQYTGDTRIQSLISLYVTGDDRLMRKAIGDLGSSLTPEGILQSRHPTRFTQIIPPFSLYWVNMLHDYWMHRPDTAFVREYLPTVERIMAWYARHLDGSTGILGAMPHWNFVDWPNEWPWSSERPSGGVPPGGIDGGSAILSLQYAYALGAAAELMDYFKSKALADQYLAAKRRIGASVMSNCFDVERGLIADDIQRTSFSQHATIMGILSAAIPLAQQRDAFKRIIDDRSLIQATVYYQFYLNRALKKVGLANEYLSRLQTWENMLDLGLSTFAERPEPSRSDCHAWSASPNYDFLATVCGVEPTSPGFRTVRVKPNLGKLNRVSGRVPHPSGYIDVSFERDRNGIRGEIILPEGVYGFYEDGNNEQFPLMPGTNAID